MADNNDSSWKEALKSKDAFADFITDYFKKNKELTDSYDIPSYYEHYTVHLDSHDGIVITLVTGVNQVGESAASALPFKQKETMSIEDFRNLILHKSLPIRICHLLMYSRRWQEFQIQTANKLSCYEN